MRSHPGGDSPAITLPTRTDATIGERAAADAIGDKVRQVLAARWNGPLNDEQQRSL